MALTKQELRSVNWSWTALGNEWGFDPRRTSLPHPDETAARNALSSSDLNTIVLAHKWKVVRKKRDTLLVECDWTQGADVPVGIKTTWQAYRQQLRDLPNNQTPSDETLSNITWPTEPS